MDPKLNVIKGTELYLTLNTLKTCSMPSKYYQLNSIPY